MKDKEILKYIIEKRRVDSELNDRLFDLDEAKVCFNLIRKYKKEFEKIPDKSELLSYISHVSPDLSKWTSEMLSVDIPIHTEKFVDDFIRERKLEQILKRSLPDSGELEDVENFHREIGRLITRSDEVERYMLTKDHYKVAKENVKAHPTSIDALNKLIGGGGFYSPQLILLMSLPKSFKTGALINVAAGYVRQGKKVLYVDYENGAGEILVRFVQHFSDATRKEVLEKKYVDQVSQLFQKVKTFGGDLRIVGLEGRRSTPDDLIAEIDLSIEDGFKPDIILLDYIDLIDDPTVKEYRHKIDSVYHAIKRINKRYGVFTISISPAGRSVLKSGDWDMSGMTEDWRKAYNADACFAFYPPEINGVDMTSEMTVFSFETIFQRIGTEDKKSHVMIDYTRQKITDLTEDQSHILGL